MVLTLIGVLTAIYAVVRADGAMKQGRLVFALVLCFLAATLAVVGVRLEMSFYKDVARTLSLLWATPP